MVRIAVCYRFPSKLPPYAEALRMAGLEVVPAPPGALRNLDNIEGLLLTGGTDIDPGLYNAPPHPETQAPDRERDASELSLLRDALDRDLPVLAICRGLQLLNVALGGTLIQDLPTEPIRHTPAPAWHDVSVLPGSLLTRTIGVADYRVNSRHHQAVGKLAPGLVVCAWAPDGVVEACELPGKAFVLGVQWHPEDLVQTSVPDRRLFDALSNAARQALPNSPQPETRLPR